MFGPDSQPETLPRVARIYLALLGSLRAGSSDPQGPVQRPPPLDEDAPEFNHSLARGMATLRDMRD